MTLLGNKPELWLLPNPPGNVDVLPLRTFEVFQILLKGGFVELGKEMGLDRRIVSTDIVDELTFAHGVLTFGAANN